MTVVKVRTASGWMELTGGPPGPEGPKGDPGSTGSGGQVYTATIGDGAAKSFVIPHNFGTRFVTVSVYRTASPYDEIVAEVERTDISSVTVRTTTVPAAGEYTVIVAGAGISAASYVHTQVASASTWTITHNLERWPSVTVVDSGGTVIIPDVHYTSANQLEVSFGGATSGKAYLN